MKTNTFNFRDVLNEIGVSLSDPRRNQVVGRMLITWAASERAERVHVLTDKTNSNSSVNAPHCICGYPFERFNSAVEYVKERIEMTDPRQMKLFD